MSTKTHFRKVYKSDHLGVADLEEYLEENRPLIFTVKEVKQELNVPVAGRKGNYNIAYFLEPNVKPLVLNVTNSNILKSFCKNSPWLEDWKNVRIELYVDANVRMKGEIVGGVRVKPVQPRPKERPVFKEEYFEKAFAAKATIESIKKTRTVTPDVEKKYVEYCKKHTK